MEEKQTSLGTVFSEIAFLMEVGVSKGSINLGEWAEVLGMSMYLWLELR